MNPWMIILLVMAGVVYGVDYLVRRKKWNDNSKAEKTSLLVHMFSVGPYLFLAALGLLWGIAAGSPETAFGQAVYDVTLIMGGTYFIVAAVSVILSLVFRKKGILKTSIWINVIALMYIATVLAVNSLAGKIL